MDDRGAELRFRRWGLRLALAGLVAASACRAQARPEESFTHTFASKEAAAQAVVDGLAGRDGERLLALAVTEREFTTRIWPALPASRAEVGMPAAYLWGDTSAKSRGHLAGILQAHGGQPFRVAAVRFSGAAADYGSFRVYPNATVSLEDAAGATFERRLFGSMIETADGWKVFSYIVD
jgi:hypothetical protein